MNKIIFDQCMVLTAPVRGPYLAQNFRIIYSSANGQQDRTPHGNEWLSYGTILTIELAVTTPNISIYHPVLEGGLEWTVWYFHWYDKTSLDVKNGLNEIRTRKSNIIFYNYPTELRGFRTDHTIQRTGFHSNPLSVMIGAILPGYREPRCG